MNKSANKFAVLMKRLSEKEYLFKLEPPMVWKPLNKSKKEEIEYVRIVLNLKVKRSLGNTSFYANKIYIWVSDERGNKKELFTMIRGGDDMTIEQVINIMPEKEQDRGSYKPLLVQLKPSTKEHFGDIVNNL